MSDAGDPEYPEHGILCLRRGAIEEPQEAPRRGRGRPRLTAEKKEQKKQDQVQQRNDQKRRRLHEQRNENYRNGLGRFYAPVEMVDVDAAAAAAEVAEMVDVDGAAAAAEVAEMVDVDCDASVP